MATPNPEERELDFQKEVRLAVVMYGGVSLAIYMNGIAQELLSLVRSTAPDSDASRFRYRENDLSGTSGVYRDLARYLSTLEVGYDPNYPQNRVRFVVDILSGTSAGGLNGMFLAKALANESPDLSALESLWISEGDIGKLLNDKGSLTESPADEAKTRKWKKPSNLIKPASLLNSDRMYARLYQALGNMNPGPDQSPAPLVDQLDLYMTATDLKGLTTPIYLSDRKVEEQKHKAVFHFQYLKNRGNAARSINDFVAANDGFMAFVGRATSSIVPAFEPMRLSHIARATDQDPLASYSGWANFYRPYWRNSVDSISPTDPKRAFVDRDFGDGGYLDNRPFTYATKTLSERTADLPVVRKLFYVEPDPIDIAEQTGDAPPHFLQHALAAVFLPAIDSIRDDIEVVRKRNEVIDRLSRIIDHVERVFVKDSINWRVDIQGESARQTPEPSPSQLSYLHLRVSAVTDAIANVMADQLGFDEDSPYRPTVRYLVRHWRDTTYRQGNAEATPVDGSEPIEDDRPDRFTEFLDAYDFAFWERCINFLHRRINKRLNYIPSAEVQDDDSANFADHRRGPPSPDGRARLIDLKRELNASLMDLRARRERFVRAPDFVAISEGNLLGISLEELSQIIRHPHDTEKGLAAKEVLDRPAPGREASRLQVLQSLSLPWQTTLIESLREFQTKLDEAFDRVAAIGPGSEEVEVVRDWRNGYELVDEVILPMTYATGALESNSVDIHRISPLDARSLLPKDPDQEEASTAYARAKLVGTTIGHFGAFFDAGGRARDILWGRLDAAERLINCLLPDGHNPKRDELRRRAHLNILATPPAIPEAFSQSELAQARKSLNQAVLKLMLGILEKARNSPVKWSSFMPLESLKSEAIQALDSLTDIPHRERKTIQAKLLALLRDPEVVERTLQANFVQPLHIENSQKVNLSGRSLNILSKMFDGIYQSPRWKVVSLVGSALSAIGKILVPNSVEDILWKHWFGLLMILAGAWILFGTLFNSPQVSSSGLVLLLVILTLGVVVRKVASLEPSQSIVAALTRMLKGVLILGLILFHALAAWAVFRFADTQANTLAQHAPKVYFWVGAATLVAGIGLTILGRIARKHK